MRQSALDHTFGRLYENCIRQFVRVKKHYKRFNLSLAYICCFVFTTSTMFYGVIIQKDNRNKAQTLFGILTSALFMILVVTHYESKDYYLRKIEQKLMPVSEFYHILQSCFQPINVLLTCFESFACTTQLGRRYTDFQLT